MASLTRQCAQLAQKRPIVATLCSVFVVLLTVRLFAWTVLGSRRHDDSLPGPHQLQQNSQGNVVNGPRRDGAAPGSAIANHCAKDQIPLFHLPVASGAKCLDGSQPAFYYRRSPTAATATKWHVHFEGGGWCWDLPWCNNRADTSYGSSKSYAACLSAASLNQKDIFSTDPALNPPLHDWQTVHVKYCDGTSYTGNAVATYKGRKLFFKGQVNRDATISYLLQQLNMRNATEVVVSGCSAGGLAVYMGLDHIAAMIHAANPRTIVRGLALSGFFAAAPAVSAAKPTPPRRWCRPRRRYCIRRATTASFRTCWTTRTRCATCTRWRTCPRASTATACAPAASTASSPRRSRRSCRRPSSPSSRNTTPGSCCTC